MRYARGQLEEDANEGNEFRLTPKSLSALMTARRPKRAEPEELKARLHQLLEHFSELDSRDLRARVRALVPAFRTLRDLGCSLVPPEAGTAARDRILHYLRSYPNTLIPGEELAVVSGIQEWARRVRELRVQFGWKIATGVTLGEMKGQGDLYTDESGPLPDLAPHDYVLLSAAQDRDAAHRWHVANQIRKREISVKHKILEFLRANVGRQVTGEELRYVAGDRSEWARRVRELRTEEGWPVATRVSGRPDLPIGVYLLEADRQSPPHDRDVPDAIRREVLRRDNYRCLSCEWDHDLWNPSDPRHLEIHHIRAHKNKGDNVEENLVTVCTVCHDEIHAGRLASPKAPG